MAIKHSLSFKNILLCAFIGSFGIQPAAVGASYSVIKSRPLYGAQNIYAEKFYNLQIKANRYDTVMLTNCSLWGSSAIEGGMVTLNNCAIYDNIEIGKNVFDQTIHLYGNTVVHADVKFQSRNGTVVLHDNARIYGRVIGGQIIQHRNSHVRAPTETEEVVSAAMGLVTLGVMAYGLVQIANSNSEKPAAPVTQDADNGKGMVLCNAHVEEPIVLHKQGFFYDSVISEIYVPKETVTPFIHLYGDSKVEKIVFESGNGIVVLHGDAQVQNCVGGTVAKAQEA